MSGNWRQRRELLLLLLVGLMPLPCLIDWTPWLPKPAVQEDQEKTPPLPGDQQRDFILKEYDTVKAEISSRIEHEHLLFVLKFTVVGAVLGLIFKTYKVGGHDIQQTDAFRALQQSSGVALCCWAAVAVSAIIDVRIFFNASLINEAGAWIQSIEGLYLNETGFRGWEQALSTGQLRSSKATPLIVVDRQLLTWLLYLVAIGIFVPWEGGSLKNRQVLDIALVAVPLCFVIFWFVGINFHFKTDSFFPYCGISMILMGMTLLWVRHRRQARPA